MTASQVATLLKLAYIGPDLPDHWPSANVTVHEDEVRHGVHRVTCDLYAPGLPPGTYDLYLLSGDEGKSQT